LIIVTHWRRALKKARRFTFIAVRLLQIFQSYDKIIVK